MAFTALEEQRIKAIEKAINKLQTAITKAVTLDQLKQMLTLRQAEIKSLEGRIATLESQVNVLQQ